jgi:RNA ligase
VNYDFPPNITLTEVLDIVKDKPEIKVSSKDGYTTIRYELLSPTLLPMVKTREHAILRECRGIIFYEQEVVSRPLHKFFNANERDETQVENIDLSKPHVILEKLDGSMIRPIPTPDRKDFRLGTKAGITDISILAEEFIQGKPRYRAFILDMLAQGLTPIFEFCSRKNKIVVDYPTDRLVLLAIRDNITGVYLDLNDFATDGIEIVKAYDNPINYVVRFADGHMLKIKCEWYLENHGKLEEIRFEKNIIKHILDDTIDDIKPLLDHERRLELDNFQNEFWKGLKETAKNLEIRLSEYQALSNGDKKGFAEIVNDKEDRLKALFFTCNNRGVKMLDELISLVKKNCGSQTDVDSVRFLWGNLRWD